MRRNAVNKYRKIGWAVSWPSRWPAFKLKSGHAVGKGKGIVLPKVRLIPMRYGWGTLGPDYFLVYVCVAGYRKCWKIGIALGWPSRRPTFKLKIRHAAGKGMARALPKVWLIPMLCELVTLGPDLISGVYIYGMPNYRKCQKISRWVGWPSRRAAFKLKLAYAVGKGIGRVLPKVWLIPMRYG